MIDKPTHFALGGFAVLAAVLPFQLATLILKYGFGLYAPLGAFAALWIAIGTAVLLLKEISAPIPSFSNSKPLIFKSYLIYIWWAVWWPAYLWPKKS